MFFIQVCPFLAFSRWERPVFPPASSNDSVLRPQAPGLSLSHIRHLFLMILVLFYILKSCLLSWCLVTRFLNFFLSFLRPSPCKVFLHEHQEPQGHPSSDHPVLPHPTHMWTLPTFCLMSIPWLNKTSRFFFPQMLLAAQPILNLLTIFLISFPSPTPAIALTISEVQFQCLNLLPKIRF